jgi:hypothetical protein
VRKVMWDERMIAPPPISTQKCHHASTIRHTEAIPILLLLEIIQAALHQVSSYTRGKIILLSTRSLPILGGK